MPQNSDIELTYRMKCYTVENERLFGDIIVTHQTVDDIYVPENWRDRAVYKRRRRNLTQEILETPDFMALNRINERNHQEDRINEDICAIEYKKNLDRHEQVDGVKKLRTYPLPMVRELSQEGAISSLVDQLLLDIYGFPRGDRSRSESESTVSSLRPTPQHRYLRKARLQLKMALKALSQCKRKSTLAYQVIQTSVTSTNASTSVNSTEELTIVLETLRSHVNHAGGLLIRQLRRRDYLLTKRDRQYDVITAHLQAHSNKRSMSPTKV